MKDLYSFHSDEKDAENNYEKMKGYYENILHRYGISEKTDLTFILGRFLCQNIPTSIRLLTGAGEDIIFVCGKCRVAINKKIASGSKPSIPSAETKIWQKKKSIKVGNIFNLKTKFTNPFDLKFTEKTGRKRCYTDGLLRHRSRPDRCGRNGGDKQ